MHQNPPHVELWRAVARTDLKRLDELFNLGASPTWTNHPHLGRQPVHQAAQHGRIGSLDWLVRHGANLNAKDGEGSTPLHIAAAFGQLELTKWLVDAGVITCLENASGERPLDMARAFDHPKVAAFLEAHS